MIEGMSAHRFFDPDVKGPGAWTLSGEEAHHLMRVRRVRPGEKVVVFNGRGVEFEAGYDGPDGRSAARLSLGTGRRVLRMPEVAVTLASPAPKGKRLDILVEKATEIGVAGLLLIRTERSVERISAENAARIERIQRVAVEACKQAGRNVLPRIEGPVPLEEMIRRRYSFLKKTSLMSRRV